MAVGSSCLNRPSLDFFSEVASSLRAQKVTEDRDKESKKLGEEEKRQERRERRAEARDRKVKDKLIMEAKALLEPRISDARQRVNDDPQDADRRVELGHMLVSIGKIPDARDQCETALALGVPDPKTGGLVHVLYAFLLTESRPLTIAHTPDGQSAGLYEVTRGLIPSLSLAWKLKSWPRHDLIKHHLAEAIRLFEAVVRGDPQDLDALRTLRDIYESLGNRGAKKGRVEALITKAETLSTLTSSPGRPAGSTTAEKGADFEHRCIRLLTAMGYQVRHTGQASDGGVDLRLDDKTPIAGGRLIVQCKNWQSSVGEPVLRDLYGLVLSEGANKGILLTTSRFTESARQFASGKPLELVDGELLQDLERQHLNR